LALAGFVQTLESPEIKMFEISRPGKSWKKAYVLENPGKGLNSKVVVLKILFSGSSIAP